MYPRLALCGLLALGSCATATRIAGHNAYMIECPGLAMSMGTCLKKANEVCPNGYNVVGGSQNAYQTSTAQLYANQYYGYGYGGSMPYIERTLVVACR